MATFLPPSTSWILPPSALPTLPSILDNTCSSVSVEKLKRRKTCRFIEEAAKRLKLPQLAAATAMVFFHRFFTKQSFGEFDRFEVAVAALFLSTKVEETPRKLVVVVETCWQLKNASSRGSTVLTAAGQPQTKPEPTQSQKTVEINVLKEKVLLLERVLLHTISFDLSVEHPYKFVIDLTKTMINQVGTKKTFRKFKKEGGTNSNLSPSDARKCLEELTQSAMSLVNDTLQTYTVLMFHSKDVALACVFFAAFKLGLEPSSIGEGGDGEKKNSNGEEFNPDERFSERWCERLGICDYNGLGVILEQMEEIYLSKRREQEVILDLGNVKRGLGSMSERGRGGGKRQRNL